MKLDVAALVREGVKAIFKIRKHRPARALCEEFVEAYRGRFPKAIPVFEAGIEDPLSYLRYPGSHHTKIRSKNRLERLFREIILRSSEEWSLRRYLRMDGLTETRENQNPQHSRR